jgi:GT2 family glycosyltransferase
MRYAAFHRRREARRESGVLIAMFAGMSPDSAAAQISEGPQCETTHPEITIIIPVHNSGYSLHQCLDALTVPSGVSTEILVVDDHSTDESRTIAEKFGVTLLSNERQLGPAAARNLAAKTAKGSILLFVDADVVVSPQTVESVAATFSRCPNLAAIFGSYDDSPLCKNVVSQYKNLMHHYIHQVANSDAVTFWTGLGAIRKDVFFRIGGFDEQRYPYPSIEDVELGYRLKKAGHKIFLDKNLQGKHLKRWTLRSVVEVDVLRRAIPWTQLMLETGNIPDDLNFRSSDRLSAGLVALLMLASPLLLIRILYSAAGLGVLWAAWILLLCIVLFLNRRAYGFLWSRKGLLFTAAGMALHFGYYAYSAAVFAITWSMFHWRRLFTTGHSEPSRSAALVSSAYRTMHPQPVRVAPEVPNIQVGGGATNSYESVLVLPTAGSPIPLLGHVAPPLLLTFAPLHKRALGFAMSIVFGALMFLATSLLILSYHGGALGPNLSLLSQFLAGYSVSWRGAIVGLFWGSVLGFLIGWGFAFVRNFVMALYFFYLKAGLEMKRYREFLAHI